jgi:hypothetical protein
MLPAKVVMSEEPRHQHYTHNLYAICWTLVAHAMYFCPVHPSRLCDEPVADLPVTAESGYRPLRVLIGSGEFGEVCRMGGTARHGTHAALRRGYCSVHAGLQLTDALVE